VTPKPLFQQVKDHVLDAIETGRLTVGDRAPSEAELCTVLGVSRMTANRALKELAEAGIVTRVAGSGSFVADRRVRGELLTIRDIADELAERGHVHRAEVLMHSRTRATADLAEAFGVEEGAALFYARVLHRQDGRPVVLEDRFVDPTIAPGFIDVDLSQETSYRYLTRVAPLQEAEHANRAVAASEELQRLLELAPDEPCLLLHRRTWTHGRVASVADLHHAGSRYEISGRFKP
jgi:GntR family histidine utilization transcriptional repressor